MAAKKKSDKGPAPAPKGLENWGEYFGKKGASAKEPEAPQVETVPEHVGGEAVRAAAPSAGAQAAVGAPVASDVPGRGGGGQPDLGWLRRALSLPDDATPFPWQQRLLGLLCRGEIPPALDLPTGLGKTSVMAIWLVARALGAPLPRRLVYVVDRRAVVDQATTVAESLRKLVDETPELKSALALETSLPISTLRGQHVDNREWLDDPSAPAIVVGTVDMVGSRLLFEGYGVSWKMRPYHAGLLGADTLLVLDEAHLVPPFERLLESIALAAERGLGPSSDVVAVIPALSLLSLSATGKSGADAFTLDEDDHAHPVVAQRVNATKALVLRPPAPKAELAARLADAAHEVAAAAGEPQRIIVFCDTRDDALKVAERLRQLSKDQRPGLFVGGRRVHERAQLAAWLEEHGFIAGRGRPNKTVFLVATSAAEVGVDLDADAAVADVVAWERMVQRLGRVNRRGNVAATVTLIPLDGSERTPELRSGSLEIIAELPQTARGADGSPASLLRLRERAKLDGVLAETIRSATTPAPLHPPLDRPVIDAWAMTSLDEHTGRPEVAPWLRGWEVDDEPRTVIAFRKHLPLLDEREPFAGKELEAFLEAAGAHASEELETEVSRAIKWLDARIGRFLAAVPTIGGPATAGAPASDCICALAIQHTKPPVATPITLDLLRDKRPQRQRERDRALAGATVLVDARLGGLDEGLLSDVQALPAPDQTSLDLTTHTGALPFIVRRVTSLDENVIEGYEPDKSFVVDRNDDGIAVAWLRVERRAHGPAVSETGRSVASRAQSLAEHQSWVEHEAFRIAARLSLDDRMTQVLRIAGRLHDEGKQAERWQRAFHVPIAQRPLAKSMRAPNVAQLGGYRHELGSLPYVELDGAFKALSEDERDLVLHLVAAHHGRARPILPTDGAEEAPSQLRTRAREVALRFDRLSRRFGPWGLAWLESLLRAADQRASKRNDQGGRRG